MTTARAILVTLRPRQWIKNGFVLAPLVFSKHLFDPSYSLRAVLAALAFCGLSGAVYAFNDLLDVEEDRRHPLKRGRPIAAGYLGEGPAGWLAAVLAAASLTACAALSLPLLAVAAGYLVNNLAYTVRLKRVAFLDVTMIAAGFMLRVIGGALAIDVPMSPYLLACTALLAMFLGFGKRAHELIVADDLRTRASLRGYDLSTLRWAMIALSLATVSCYALYTQDQRTIEFFGSHRLIVTVPFCVIGIARFLQLALRTDKFDSPTDAILKDWPFMLNLLAWGATVLTIIYWW